MVFDNTSITGKEAQGCDGLFLACGPVAYFAAENSFSSLRALPTASFNAGPRRSLAKIRPLGPIRNVAGIPRIEYVSPTFWKSFAGTARTLHGTGPPNTCVQLSAFALVYFAGAWAASSHDTPTSKNLGSPPNVCLDVLHRGHLGEARLAPRRPEVEQDELAPLLAQLELAAVEPWRREVGGEVADSQIKPGLHVPDIDRLVLRSFRHGHGERRLTHRGAWGARGPRVGRQIHGDL